MNSPQPLELVARRGWRFALAERIGAARRPRAALAAVVTLIYAVFVPAPFMFDDYRNLRLLREFDSGQRTDLPLYRFAAGARENAEFRRGGLAPWWVADNLRFNYFRPATTALIWAEYQLFGRHPAGYRLCSLGLYIVGVWLVLAVYRWWCGDETLARWAALAFAVAGCNAVPVVFIAAQCDLLALAAAMAALVCVTRFIDRGALAWLAAGGAAFATALLSKESSVPVAALPAVLVLSRVAAPPARRRGWIAAALFGVMAAALVAAHAIGGYGSNSALILDPLGDPLDYLRRMPLRALLLLTTWITQTSPLLFDFNDDYRGWLLPYTVLGAAGLAAVLVMLARRFRRERLFWGALLWVAVFLPLLACTNPDNRIMMLPMVGFALVAALWLTGRSPAAADYAIPPQPPFRLVPFWMFIVSPAVSCAVTAGSMAFIERAIADNIRQAAAAFGRPLRPEDRVFLLSTNFQMDLLWCADRAAFLLGDGRGRWSYLSHMKEVEPIVLGPRTLRLRAVSEPFFHAFLGRLPQTRAGGFPQRADAGEYTAAVSEVRGGEVTAVDFTFNDRLDSDRYRFLVLKPDQPAQRWHPPVEVVRSINPQDYPASR